MTSWLGFGNQPQEQTAQIATDGDQVILYEIHFRFGKFVYVFYIYLLLHRQLIYFLTEPLLLNNSLSQNFLSNFWKRNQIQVS